MGARIRGFLCLVGLGCVLWLGGMGITGGAKAQGSGPQGGEQPASPGERWLPFVPGSGTGSGPQAPRLELLIADSQAVELKVTLPGVMAQDLTEDGQVYTRLYGEGYGFASEVGMPSLPVLRGEIEIPFGAAVSLEGIDGSSQDISLEALGIHPIYPVQPPAVKLPEADSSRSFSIRRDFYEGDAQFPAQPVQLGEPAVLRGHRLLPVEVWPVTYLPEQGTLRIYSEMTIRLSLAGSDLAQSQARASRAASPYEQALEGQVLNYNLGATAAPQSGTGPGYLIISADAYLAALQPFIQWKSSQGYAVTSAALSQIPGSTTPQGIKAYIQNAYDNWPNPPSYLLLVGDTDSLPTWHGSGSPGIPSSAVTDLYYATLDGADWVPDLGRGRFPVRSAAQTTTIVNKYLAYASRSGNEAWLKQAAFPATCDPTWWQLAEGTHNYAINTYTRPLGFTGIFPVNPQPGGDKLYCKSYPGASYYTSQAINQGRNMVVYSGHGSHSGWEMLTGTGVKSLTNAGMYPFVASHACMTGDFEEVQVFGETWLLEDNKGALAFWGSSDNTFWGQDDVLERAWTDALFANPGGQVDVTSATYAGLRAVGLAYPGFARYYWEAYNLLGDPSLELLQPPQPPAFSLGVPQDPMDVCTTGGTNAPVDIFSSGGYASTVRLATGPLPGGISAGFAPQAGNAPFRSILALQASPGAAPGDYQLSLNASDNSGLHQQKTLGLQVAAQAPGSPRGMQPQDGSAVLSGLPVFSWLDPGQASRYTFQIGTNPLFTNPLADIQGIGETTFAWQTPLEAGRCYWWRVRAENGCGVGTWSGAQHFLAGTSQAAPPAFRQVLPGEGSSLVENRVRILGNGFSGDVAVRLGQDTWVQARRVDAQTIEVMIPSGLQVGNYPVLVFNGDCQGASLAGTYTVRGYNSWYLPLLGR